MLILLQVIIAIAVITVVWNSISRMLLFLGIREEAKKLDEKSKEESKDEN